MFLWILGTRFDKHVEAFTTEVQKKSTESRKMKKLPFYTEETLEFSRKNKFFSNCSPGQLRCRFVNIAKLDSPSSGKFFAQSQRKKRISYGSFKKVSRTGKMQLLSILPNVVRGFSNNISFNNLKGSYFFDLFSSSFPGHAERSF